MPKLIYVNLPVADLPKATAFYEAIGATKNPQFSDVTANCIPTPTQDFGFIFGRSFEDLDGHIWELMWMDLEAAAKACAQQGG
jgi:predicted lactoylglutathione lyase